MCDMKWFQPDKPAPKTDNPFEVTEESDVGLQYFAPRTLSLVIVHGLSDEDKRAAAEAHESTLSHMYLSKNAKFF